MRLLNRVQALLRVALVTLMLGLAAAVTIGVLLRPPPPVGFAATTGRPLLRTTGIGPVTTSNTVVRFREHAVGVAVRCSGTGTIRVVLHPSGAAESSCAPDDRTEGGFVLSDTATNRTFWEIQTRPGNRWSLVLTQPATDGLELEP